MKHSFLLLDLDGTTLDSHKKVSNENLEAIRKFIDKGGYVCFASGRNLGNVVEFAKMLNLESVWHIGINGNILMNIEKDETIVINKLTEDMYQNAVDYIVKNDLSAAAMMPKTVVFRNSQEGAGKWAFTENGYNSTGEITGLKDVVKFNISTRNDDERRTYSSYMESLGFEITISSLDWIECLNPGCDKYTGAVRLCEMLGKDINEICAIGDYENDYALLSQVDLAVCPKNATDHVKGVCDIVLPVSNDESAVSYLINNYLLKE